MSAVDADKAVLDLAMMQAPHCWPCWPLLPLTARRGSFNDADYCSFLFSDGRPTIYMGLVDIALMRFKAAAPGMTNAQVLADFERREYASFEAVNVDWTVD